MDPTITLALASYAPFLLAFAVLMLTTYWRKRDYDGAVNLDMVDTVFVLMALAAMTTGLLIAA